MTNVVPPVDDHPEELLDRACDGRLGDADWRQLRSHLALCLPCRTQLQMNSRSLVERRVKSSDLHLNRIAVNQVFQRSMPSRWAFRPTFAQRWMPIGVGLLLLSGGAGAATWWSVRHPDEKPVVAHPPSAAPAPAGVRAGPRAGSSPNVGPPSAPLDVQGRADRSSATELFARARGARLSGNSTAALSIYRRLQRAYPDSPEGHLSYLVVGRMWLEHDRPDLAASQFSRYLDTSGSASEEALVGRATALGRTGRLSEESADWKRLLAKHPGSVYARRARARLGELGKLPGPPRSAPGHP